MVRIGPVHYNTMEEVERFGEALRWIATNQNAIRSPDLNVARLFPYYPDDKDHRQDCQREPNANDDRSGYSVDWFTPEHN